MMSQEQETAMYDQPDESSDRILALPDAGAVKWWWIEGRSEHVTKEQAETQFDAWIAEYTREVAANAVNVFEDLYFGPGLGQTREWVARCARERLGLPPRLTNE